jgi:hypothetical protein
MLRSGSEKVSWLTFVGCCDVQCTTCEGKPHKSAVRFLRSRRLLVYEPLSATS